MSVFNEYSRYYDLFYRDKDYRGEAGYVDSLIRSHAPDARTILNLGCGSGRHDRCLADLGYQVSGVDQSEEMLQVARTAAAGNLLLAYTQGDVRSVRLTTRFDVVVSLFHVMSYQITNHDLQAAFSTAQAHLDTGGIFIFDCWYGPGVLSDPPVTRVKDVIADDGIHVTRIAQPVTHSAENVVDVNYRVLLTNPETGTYREIFETHRMRYLFCPEVELMLSSEGLKLLTSVEWLTNSPLNASSWNALFVASKPG